MMGRVLLFLLVMSMSLVMVTGCIVKFDNLEYYKKGYSPNNSMLSTNGVYYKIYQSPYLDTTWPNAVEYLTFFKDGSFTFGSIVENIDTLNSYLCKYPEGLNIYVGGVGVYTIKNDTIFTEYLIAQPNIFNYAKRNYFKAIITNIGVDFIELNNKDYKESWTFNQNDCVPDSVDNLIMTHRKYKFK